MMQMKNVMMASALAAGFGLLALDAPPADAQQYPAQQYPQQEYQGRYARSRDLVALQDDLRLLDDSMRTLSRRNPRYPEFERRTEDVRRDVTALAEEINRHRRDRQDGYDDRRDGYGGAQAEVAALRHNIATLRDDVQEAQMRGRRGDNRAYVIPAGTQIQVMLEQNLSSRSSNIEDRVEASTIHAIGANGRTVIPAGATVLGSVREVRSRHRGQRDGWLRLDFNSMVTEGGPEVPMRSTVVAVSNVRSRRDNDALRNSGLGALLGGVVGGIIDGKQGALIGAAVGAGGGLLASQGNDDVDLREGTLVTLRLDAPMTVSRVVAYRR